MKKLSPNIEIIMYIILLTMFVFCFFILILTGKVAQQKMLNENAVKTNVKLASTYIDVKLKQNDKSDNIYVKENPNTNNDALVILNDGNNNLTNTWIYFDKGALWESKTIENAPPNSKTATEIAKIDGFNIKKNNQNITYEISYIYNNIPYTNEYVVILRSV